MKTIKNLAKLMLMGILSVLSFFACTDDSKMTFVNHTIDSNELPVTAQIFISESFPKAYIISIEFENAKYEVRLNNGAEIDFDLNGNWEMVDCLLREVPAHIIPIEVANTVKEQFPDAEITRIEKEHYGYDVELSNDLDLKFNFQGMILDMGF